MFAAGRHRFDRAARQRAIVVDAVQRRERRIEADDVVAGQGTVQCLRGAKDRISLWHD
jgi:hypothetical protein